MEELLKTTRAYRLLERECEEGTCSHAYLLLFNDARNIRFALKTFAKLFFYTENEKENARRAKLIDEECFSDCLFFPDEGKKLVVENAETIQEESQLAPIETERKLFLLADFAEANAQTQNKLLKLLEEPPKGVTFLLGATSVYPVLSTVLSRTKKMEIPPFSQAETVECLHRIYKNEHTMSSLSVCAALADGVVGEAQNMLEGGAYKALLDNAFALVLEPDHRLPPLVKTVGEIKQKKEFLSLLRLVFRDALLVKAGMKGALLQTEQQRIKLVAANYSRSALLFAQTAIAQAELEVQFNAVFPQCVETCVAKIRKHR